MSVLNLPEPSNWAKTDTRLVWVSIGFTVFLGYFIVRGILAALRGNYLTTVLVIGIVTFPLLMMTALLLAATGKTRARTTSDAAGFTVWPDKRYGAMYFIGMAATAPSAFLFAFFIPRGMIDIPMSRGMQIFSPALFVAAAVFAIFALVAGLQRGGVGYLKFTPAMVEIADVIKTRTLEWNDIVDIKDHSDTKDGKKAGRSVVLCLRDGSEKVIGGLNLYVPTGVALYWMVRHYWKHPEDRMELVDHRAAERFRDGRFALD